MNKYLLKLYITGQTPRSTRAVANLRQICDEKIGEECELVIIDILERTQLAEDDKVLATPMLIKQLPPPTRRFIGDLSDMDKVLVGLDLQPRSGFQEQEGNE